MAYANHSHVQANLLVFWFSRVACAMCKTSPKPTPSQFFGGLLHLSEPLFMFPYFMPGDTDESLCLNQDHLPLSEPARTFSLGC